MERVSGLFLDIGGVLLTNGWDRHMRAAALEKFNLNDEEFDERHHQYYDSHERGEITLDEYLQKVVFWKERPFTVEQFKAFMFAQSKPYPEMLDFIGEVKEKYRLKVALVSNEGRDLAEYRIKTYRLTSLADFFFVSSFVHYQKPDPRIFNIALDVTQVDKAQVVYIDDRANLIEAATKLGLHGIVHDWRDVPKTKKALLQLL